MHGWIILDKPAGLGSTPALARVKALLRRAGHGRVKAGHGGTLDPAASGVLPIALGEATKLAQRLLDASKAYRFTLAFGAATDSDDAEGAVVATSPVRPSRQALQAALPAFTGRIRQRPPAVSALKVAGRRAYDLARAGAPPQLAEREIVVTALRMEAAHGPDEALEAATLAVECSKGTYVRALARDLAQALGTLGHVTMLRRTRSGPFGLDQAVALDLLERKCQEGCLAGMVLPLAAGLVDIPALAVTPDEAAALRQGQRLAGRSGPSGLHVAMLGAVPVALVAVGHDGVRVERGFNLPDVAE